MARGSAGSNKLRGLLQAIFFEAHVSQRRVIEDRQLYEAALGLEQPDFLADIRKRAATTTPFTGVSEIELWDFVEVEEGEHRGRRGVIQEIFPGAAFGGYSVIFSDGTVSGWLKGTSVRSSGLSETAFLVQAMSASEKEVRDACVQLSHSMRESLEDLHRRVACDDLPLLRLLQAEPLQLQSSHLTFQEFFTARAISDMAHGAYGHCSGQSLFSGSPPWQWPAWWANTIAIGVGMGDEFGRGLLHAACVQGNALDLAQRLGGHPQTAQKVVTQFMAHLTSLNLSDNILVNEGVGIGTQLASNSNLQELCLRRCSIGVVGCCVIAKGLEVNKVIKKLVLTSNPILDDGAKAIGRALASNRSLEELNMAKCSIGEPGAIGLANGLKRNTVLKTCDLKFNCFTHRSQGGSQLADAVQGRDTFELLWKIAQCAGAGPTQLLCQTAFLILNIPTDY